MKNKKVTIVVIILLIILILVLLGGMIHMLGKNHRIRRYNENLVIDQTYTNKYANIEVESDAGDIEIKETDEENIRVIIYGENDRSDVRDIGNTLKITIKAKKCFGICFNIEMSKVVVYLPKNYKGTIDLSNKYGDIDVGSFKEAKVLIKEDCGDVKVESALTLDAENSYGDITIGEVETATVKQSCGNVKIDYLKRGNIKNKLGDVKIKKVDGEISIEEDCGDIVIDELYLTDNSDIKNSFGDIKLGQTNEIYIDAQVSLGDIKIDENYRKSSITLKLKNDCGDIKVSN